MNETPIKTGFFLPRHGPPGVVPWLTDAQAAALAGISPPALTARRARRTPPAYYAVEPVPGTRRSKVLRYRAEDIAAVYLDAKNPPFIELKDLAEDLGVAPRVAYVTMGPWLSYREAAQYLGGVSISWIRMRAWGVKRGKHPVLADKREQKFGELRYVTPARSFDAAPVGDRGFSPAKRYIHIDAINGYIEQFRVEPETPGRSGRVVKPSAYGLAELAEDIERTPVLAGYARGLLPPKSVAAFVSGFVQAVENGAVNGMLGIAAVAGRLGVTPTTIHRLLKKERDEGLPPGTYVPARWRAPWENTLSRLGKLVWESSSVDEFIEKGRSAARKPGAPTLAVRQARAKLAAEAVMEDAERQAKTINERKNKKRG